MLHAVRKGYSDYIRKRTKGQELPLMSVSSESDRFQPLKQAEYCTGGRARPPQKIAGTAVCSSTKNNWKASFLPLPYSSISFFYTI